MGKRQKFQGHTANRSMIARMAAFAVYCTVALALLAQPLRAQTPPAATLIRAEIALAPETTQFVLDLTASVAAEVYTLASPYRVVIDLPDAALAPTGQKPQTSAQTPAGLIKSFRSQEVPGSMGGVRVVIETAGPVEIASAGWVPGSLPSTGARLQLTLKTMDKTAFGRGTGDGLAQAPLETGSIERADAASLPTLATATTPVQTAFAAAPIPARPAARPAATEASPVKPALFDDAIAATPVAARPKPIVMIDPGHGGIDPGAIGPAKIAEKTIVLAVATQVKAALEATGRYDVHLTRSTDVFIPLDKRVALSKQVQADIFLSLHADTIEDTTLARSIRGASVYTLSDKASNEEARIMAEKENAADLVAGLSPSGGDTSDDIKPILFDLMARETSIFSRLLSRSIIGALSKNHPMAHEPERAAAFRVLRQANAPSVLIELGFLSNPREEQLMTEAAWQRQIASAITAAVDTYFSRKGSTMATAPFGGDVGGLPP